MPDSVEWEVLVIDNNSTDGTRDVVEGFARRNPALVRYLVETRQGKSRALNLGVRAARGDILVFTDDDVIVESSWLGNLTVPLRHGPWSAVGGRVLPAWSCPPPAWVPSDETHGLAPLAHFDRGVEPGRLQESPVGCNMAITRSMFARYGGFRTDLGPCATANGALWSADVPPRTSEDSDFCQRLMDGGESLYYEPAAVVHHPVPAHRLTKTYFLTWWLEKGRGDARQHGAKAGTRLYILGIPVYAIRSISLWTLKWLLAMEPRRRFRNKLLVWKKLGEMLEFYRGTARQATSGPMEQPS
jgi:glycosyltransferase involved in cell wall biosynthesis